MTLGLRVVVATGNAHKVAEIQSILVGLPVFRFDEVFGHPHDAVEDGLTFEANAIKKIDFLPLLPDTIYLSDDSGLEVDALNGAPGIYSARYAGLGATSTQMCTKILNAIEGNPNRQARFRCVIALRFPDGRIETVNGESNGHLSDQLRGEEGFGYDPIFIPEGFDQTFGQMPAELKHSLSHRGRALRLAAETLLR